MSPASTARAMSRSYPSRGVTFHFMAVGQLLLTYPSRHTWTRPLSNPYLHVAVVIGITVQIGAASLPLTAGLLGNAALPNELWGLVFAIALFAWATAEAIARFVWRERGKAETGRMRATEGDHARSTRAATTAPLA